jgi:predicted ATPase/DNA-binding SARP family transcriptional activator
MAAGTAADQTEFAQFRILGPLEVVRSGCAVPLGGPRQRAVLAVLLLEANRVVPFDRLAEDVWGGHPPGSVTTLQTYVFHLRRALDPDRLPGAGGDVLVTRDRGYQLRVNREHLDAAVFEEGLAAGQAALAAGQYAEAAEGLRNALALWRGPVLADLADYAFIRPETARLEELRLAAIEDRIDADLALGRHHALTGELERLVGEYPLRERLQGQLMLTLYRCGRQAEALAVYRRVRELLSGELGIEPGEELRRLERAVLRQEVPAAAPRRALHNLPVRLTSFVGRETELAALEGLLGEARMVTLTGVGGAGKTRLAVEFAAAAVERFGDGVWLADLAGIADAELVPSVVMEALGLRQSGEVAVLEVLCSRLRSVEILLVLDNCEHLLGACADLAVTLLGRCRGVRVLATSREPLGVPGEAVRPVPPLVVPAEPAGKHAIAASAAVRLFVDRGNSAVAGPGGLDAPVEVVARICRELDGLPLAIELAAARTSVLSAEEIEAHLADKFRFLASRHPAADPRHQTLKTAVGWSYDLLSEEERRVFCELSVFAGGFTLAAVAAVCCGGDQASALDLVDRLAAKSLLIAEPASGRTRYRLLETIRQFAAGCLSEAGQAGPARRRHAEAFLQLAEEERDLAVLAREQDNFRAALDFTLSGGSPAGLPLARALGGFWLARGLISEGLGWLERALAAGPADERLRADLHRLLGAGLYAAGDLEQAQATLADGAQVAAAAGLRSVQARIRVLQAEIQALTQSGIYVEARQACEAAAALLESEGELEGAAEAWLSVGKLRLFDGDTQAAEQALERAADRARQSGNHHAQRQARAWLVANLEDLPMPVDVAVGHAEQQLEAAAGDPWPEAAILQNLALLYALAGRFADARAAYQRGRSISAASGAKLSWARCTMLAGRIEMMAGNPVEAERILTEGNEALQAMGERAYRASILAELAAAVYAQGRLRQALRLTEEAEALGVADYDAEARWRATRAKVLARAGNFPAATRLAEEAVALIPATADWPQRAEFLVAKAEVSQLAGALDEAEDSLRRALRFYDGRQMVLLAERTRALLASLTAQRHAEEQLRGPDLQRGERARVHSGGRVSAGGVDEGLPLAADRGRQD